MRNNVDNSPPEGYIKTNVNEQGMAIPTRHIIRRKFTGKESMRKHWWETPRMFFKRMHRDAQYLGRMDSAHVNHTFIVLDEFNWGGDRYVIRVEIERYHGSAQAYAEILRIDPAYYLI